MQIRCSSRALTLLENEPHTCTEAASNWCSFESIDTKCEPTGVTSAKEETLNYTEYAQYDTSNMQLG